MTPATRRSRDTRAVYQLEDILRAGARREPIAALRALAGRVWRDYVSKHSLRPRSEHSLTQLSTRRLLGNRCPTVIAGDGIRWQGEWCSYCLGRSKIVLARHHRDRIVLLHEMTHALGPVTHGKRFQNLFAELLERYS